MPSAAILAGDQAPHPVMARRRAIRRQHDVAFAHPDRRRSPRRQRGALGLPLRSGLPDRRLDFMGMPFDLMQVDEALAFLAQRTEFDSFAYIVTPNVDHVVRLRQTPHLIGCYRDALLSWCDSRPLRRIALMLGVPLPHLAGSDMVERIFAGIVRPGDALVFITADDDLLADLRRLFSLQRIAGYTPPFGFEHDASELQKCIRFIEEHPARFVFLGVGSPRSERVVHLVQQNGRARGTALCIGAALEFTVGRKRRAPAAILTIGMEWVYRLSTEPRRLWRRYLFSVPGLLVLAAEEAKTRLLSKLRRGR